MTSEPRVNCQRGGKGLVRVGLSDKGVGTSTLSFPLHLSLSLVFCLFLSLLSSAVLPSLSFFSPQSPLARYGSRAHPPFFSPLFAFLISFSSVVGSERARTVARIGRNNGLPRGELNRKRIKFSCHPALAPSSRAVTPRLRQRYFERRIWDVTLIGIPRVHLIIPVTLSFLCCKTMFFFFITMILLVLTNVLLGYNHSYEKIDVS